MPLETAQLQLFPWVPSHLAALIDAPSTFESLAGFPAADGLRAMMSSDDAAPEWLAELRRGTTADPWRYGFFLVDRASNSVVGSIGFAGPIDDTGTVEIAYGVVPSVEGRGYATEAAQAVIAFALEEPSVMRLRAHTLPVQNASTRILTKCGFARVEDIVDPHDGPVWRWERPR